MRRVRCGLAAPLGVSHYVVNVSTVHFFQALVRFYCLSLHASRTLWACHAPRRVPLCCECVEGSLYSSVDALLLAVLLRVAYSVGLPRPLMCPTML